MTPQAQTSFSEILDRAPSEIEKPKPIPPGTYTTILVGVPRQDKSAKKQTPFVEFSHKMIAAGEDVDQEALTEALTSPDGSTRALQDVTMKNTFYLTENSAWRLKDFLKDCGFNTDDESTTLREMIEQSSGHTVNIHVKHEPSQDGQTFFATVGGTSATE